MREVRTSHRPVVVMLVTPCQTVSDPADIDHLHPKAVNRARDVAFRRGMTVGRLAWPSTWGVAGNQACGLSPLRLR